MENKRELANYYIKLINNNILKDTIIEASKLNKIEELYKELADSDISISLLKALAKYLIKMNIEPNRLCSYLHELMSYYNKIDDIASYEKMLFIYLAIVVISYKPSAAIKEIDSLDRLPAKREYLIDVLMYNIASSYNDSLNNISHYENRVEDYYTNKYDVVENIGFEYYKMIYLLGRIRYYIRIDDYKALNIEYKKAMSLLLLSPSIKGYMELFLVINKEYLNYVYKNDLAFTSLRDNISTIASEYIAKIPSTSIYDYEGEIIFNTKDYSIKLEYVDYYHIYTNLNDYSDYALIMSANSSGNGLIFLRGLNSNTSFKYINDIHSQIKYLKEIIYNE